MGMHCHWLRALNAAHCECSTLDSILECLTGITWEPTIHWTVCNVSYTCEHTYC